MRKIYFTLLTFISIGLISCSNLTEEFLFMNDLKESIADKYESENIEIKINNKTALIVLIKDSKFDDYSGKKKEKISYEIGKMATDLNENNVKITTGVVTFVSEENYGISKKSETNSYQMYK